MFAVNLSFLVLFSWVTIYFNKHWMNSSTSNCKQIPFKEQHCLSESDNTFFLTQDLSIWLVAAWTVYLNYLVKNSSKMIKKYHEIYCLEHNYFGFKCSYTCHPTELSTLHSSRALPMLCCYSCLCGKSWSTHVLLPHRWTQQMVCAELSRWAYSLLTTHVILWTILQLVLVQFAP